VFIGGHSIWHGYKKFLEEFKDVTLVLYSTIYLRDLSEYLCRQEVTFGVVKFNDDSGKIIQVVYKNLKKALIGYTQDIVQLLNLCRFLSNPL